MKTNRDSSSFSNMRSAKRILIALAAALSVVALVWLSLPAKPETIQWLGDSWVFKEKKNGPVIGDLGGVPVSIPEEFANYVEYDDDPSWMERRKGAPPKRTYQSKLRGFGFEIRYPDMKGVTAETEAERKLQNIYTTTWMRVGVKSHSHYGSSGDTGNEARVANIPTDVGYPYRYEKLPKPVYGLTGYTPIGVEKSLRKRPNGPPWEDRNIYFYRSGGGKVETYVECGNGEHRATRCEMRFILQPVMRASVTVNFRKEMLPHWQAIQSSVSQVILGFRVAEPTQSSNVNK